MSALILPRRRLWLPWFLMAVAHLQKRSDGHLKKNAAGNLVKRSCTCAAAVDLTLTLDAYLCSACDLNRKWTQSVSLNATYTIPHTSTSGTQCTYTRTIDYGTTIVTQQFYTDASCATTSGPANTYEQLTLEVRTDLLFGTRVVKFVSVQVKDTPPGAAPEGDAFFNSGNFNFGNTISQGASNTCTSSTDIVFGAGAEAVVVEA